ncbi:MAG: hypothetical protein FJX74_21890, partial [Armatimonadetes bacterium]|nr:hypothetical protein [Armatimonadota bacterium]
MAEKWTWIPTSRERIPTMEADGMHPPNGPPSISAEILSFVSGESGRLRDRDGTVLGGGPRCREVLDHLLRMMHTGEPVSGKDLLQKVWGVSPSAAPDSLKTVTETVRRLKALLKAFASSHPEHSAEVQILSQTETGEKGYKAVLSPRSGLPGTAVVAEGPDDPRWFRWRGRAPRPVQRIWVAQAPQRGLSPERVRLRLDPQRTYELPQGLRPHKEYLLGQYREAHPGCVLEDLPRFRYVDWHPTLDNSGGVQEVEITGHSVMFYDHVVTNLSLDCELPGSRTRVRDKLGDNPSTVRANCGNPL